MESRAGLWAEVLGSAPCDGGVLLRTAAGIRWVEAGRVVLARRDPLAWCCDRIRSMQWIAWPERIEPVPEPSACSYRQARGRP